MAEPASRILVVDDDFLNRSLLTANLTQAGHEVVLATNGREALEQIEDDPPDMILLDIVMPEVDGFEVLETLKRDEHLRSLPVVMISAMDELDSVVRCISLGADDYLPKPFEPALLRARIDACLEKKRLRDRERQHLEQIRAEQAKSERLLLSILPRTIAERLKHGETAIADRFEDAGVMFADAVGFTPMSATVTADELVERLNVLFLKFDNVVERYGLEKIKTNGDSYMLASGVPVPRPDHAEALADAALDMVATVKAINADWGWPLEVRIGLCIGPLVAGVIGCNKFIYDLWGDTVNTASRMESHGESGRIHVPRSVADRLADRFEFEPRGSVLVKGKGPMETSFLVGRR